MNNKVNSLVILFKNNIEPWEQPLLRGGVLGSLSGNANILFHNHDNDNYRYGYPLIQYKRIHNNAAIVCVMEGTEIIGQFFTLNNLQIQLGERQVDLEIDKIFPRSTVVNVWDTIIKYRLKRWIPFNEVNYEKYMKEDGQIERLELLKRILIGNILSFAKGVGAEIDQAISCKIVSLSRPFRVKVKDAHPLCFDIEFSCNVSLPDYIGLGKHSSIGFGLLSHCKDKNNNQEQ